MSSSTSSFRTEWKVLAVVLAVLAGFEVVARQIGSRLDWDREHIHRFPEIARRLHAHGGKGVLFLGNSLTLHGVDLDVVRATLRHKGQGQAAVERVVPVGTDVTDWIYIYDRYFRNGHQCPDVVVIGYVRHHMRDLKPPKRLRRLGRHFVAWQDFGECFSQDVLAYDDRVEVLLSKAWASFGDQPVYRDWGLYPLVPNFRTGERRLNRMLERLQARQAEARRNGAPPPEPTFDRVARLAELLKDTGAHGIFVAMPLPEPWEMDPQVARIVQDAGMTFVDARTLDGLRPEDFPDGYHMGDEAMERFSRMIGEKIAEHLNGP